MKLLTLVKSKFKPPFYCESGYIFDSENHAILEVCATKYLTKCLPNCSFEAHDTLTQYIVDILNESF